MVDAEGRETDGVTQGRRDALHLERGVAAPGRHREARWQRPDDAARQLRPIQSGRADRRARPDLAQASRRSRRWRTRRRPAAIRGSSRWSIRRSTRARSSHAHAAYRRVLAGARSRDHAAAEGVGRVHPKARQRLHRLDGHGRPVPRGDANARRRHGAAGLRPDERHVRSALLPDEPGQPVRRTTTDWWSPCEKRLSKRWQASGSYTYSRAPRPAGDEQWRRGRAAVQHDRPPGFPDVRPGSERPHECHGPAAERPAARLPGDRGRAPAVAGHPGRGQPAALQRQAVGARRRR